MQPAPAYYTDDITLLPARLIWRFVAPGGIVAPFLFSWFYFRKLLHWPYRANFAAPYPDSLPVRPIDSLPVEARNAFALAFPEMDACGLTFAFCTITPFIGTKWGASAIFTTAERELYASIVWIRIKLGAFDRTETTISCHSLLPSGITLSTAAIPEKRWIPEMIPSRVKMTRLPENANLPQILGAHRETLRTCGAAPLQLNESALQAHILSTMQALYEHLIGNKLYRKLSDAEVKRLKPAS
jgi:hypothetical protein